MAGRAKSKTPPSGREDGPACGKMQVACTECGGCRGAYGGPDCDISGDREERARAAANLIFYLSIKKECRDI